MLENIANGTAVGLVTWLDDLVQKGRTRSGVVAPLKSAVTTVLKTTEGESWDKIELKAVDIPDTMQRFKNKTLGKYTTQSYQAYEARFVRAVNWYAKFLDEPGWFPKNTPSQLPSPTPAKQTSSPRAESAKASTPTSLAQTNSSFSDKNDTSSTSDLNPLLVSYPFPLEKGSVARLYIPSGLTAADATRLAEFVKALVIIPGESTN